MSENSNHAGDWRAAIRELAAFDRPSASDGERRGAELIAARLRGARMPSHDRAGARPRRLLVADRARQRGRGRGRGPRAAQARSEPTRAVAAAIAGVGAAALWDDLGHGRRWFRRAVLPHRSTWNVVAEAGDPDAERTVVFIAHHDAAHSGLVFHPALPRIPLKLAPRLHARAGRSFPLMYTVWLGPVLVCAGSVLGVRRALAAGSAIAAAATAAMVDIGARASVPGANDNLSAVGAVIALAALLRERPVEGARVLLVSTGLRGIVQRGDAGVRRASLRRSRPRADRDGLPRVPRRSDADRRRGRGHAPDARLPGPHARGACATPRPTPASRSRVGCGRRPPPTRSSRCAPATPWPRSRRSTRRSSR